MLNIFKKRNKKKKHNQGNSFIMIIATVSFLAILVAAILVAVALCYRLKAYDINSEDNFYYLEQAMDEIYAGVGGDAMGLLNEAYDDTLEVMVYYDTAEKAYVTMDSDEANRILKTTYMKLVQSDGRYDSVANITTRLNQFLSYPYQDADGNEPVTGRPYREGVQISVKERIATEDNLSICEVILKREAKYSTVNTKKGADASAADTFVQTITTDLVIAKPEFQVKFNPSSSNLSDLYSFAMVSDMGIEIVGKNNATAIGKRVNITGNVYAASDFYNKKYNENPDIVESAVNAVLPEETQLKEDQLQPVSKFYAAGVSDEDREKDMASFDGVKAKSMYSGMYIDGAEVFMSSDRIIVPGSLAVMNSGGLTISSIAGSSADYTDVWADGIVLDGYSLKQDAEGKKLKGSSLDMRAYAYIYDDLEVNAHSSSVLLNGEYYGYNFAATDNRTFIASAAKGLTDTSDQSADGTVIENQAHYNSSAIILNGEQTSLDFSLVDSLYVAGQSYIEVSKATKEADKDKKEKVTYNVDTDEGTVEMTDTVGMDVDSYPTATKDADGTYTDNYTIDHDDKTPSKTPIQDYQTGEAISVKSNQLAYIPTWTVTEDADTGRVYVKLPTRLRELDAYKDIWDDFDKIPVIKTVISGKPKYFLDFSEAKDVDPDVMSNFISDYAALFSQEVAVETEEETSEDDEAITSLGKANGLIDITDYEHFEVEMLKLQTNTVDGKLVTNYEGIYTNAAISAKIGVDYDLTISPKRNQSTKALVTAAKRINQAISNGGRGDFVGSTTGGTAEETARMLANSVTTKLTEQYKEARWLLTTECTDANYVTQAHVLPEDSISPINHFFDFSKLNSDDSALGKNIRFCALNSGYGVWYFDDDIEIGATGYTYKDKDVDYADNFSFASGKVKGLVLTKGNVTFKDDVTEFEGLIVSGGKVIIDNFSSTNENEMVISANEEMIKNILKECDMSRGNEATTNFGFVCDTFRLFETQYEETTQGTDTPVETAKNVSSVQYEDILAFRNWKKNVD